MTRISRAVLEIALALFLLAAVWLVVHHIRHPEIAHFDDRLPGILHQAELVPSGGVLVIGDSITAANYIPTLCGRPALNAGIGWSDSHQWAPHVAELIRKARPDVVVIALGENDDHDGWQDDYRKIARFGTFAVTPRQPDRAAFIRSLLPSVPVPSQTYDGVHLTAEGDREWTRRVEAKCRELGLTKA